MKYSSDSVQQEREEEEEQEGRKPPSVLAMTYQGGDVMSRECRRAMMSPANLQLELRWSDCLMFIMMSDKGNVLFQTLKCQFSGRCRWTV